MKKPKGKKEEEKNNELYMQQVHIDRERGTGHKEIYQRKRAVTMTINKSMKERRDMCGSLSRLQA